MQVTDITQNLSDGAAKMGQDLQEKVNTLATFELEVRNTIDLFSSLRSGTLSVTVQHSISQIITEQHNSSWYSS